MVYFTGHSIINYITQQSGDVEFMVETYSFLFWSHDREVSDEYIAQTTCNIAELLKLYVGEPVINYETGYSKSSVRHIAISKDFMLQKLRQMRKHSRTLNGFIFSFFSSLDDAKMIGIRFAFGDFRGLMPNSVIVHFPPAFFTIQKDHSKTWRLFQELTYEIHPYYAVFANNQNKELSKKYWEQKPTLIHTYNFFDNDTIRLIGKKKLLMEPGLEATDSGAFLKLLPEHLRLENKEHLQKQKEVSQRLALL